MLFRFCDVVLRQSLTGFILDGLPREPSQSIPIFSKKTLTYHRRIMSVHFLLYGTVMKLIIFI